MNSMIKAVAAVLVAVALSGCVVVTQDVSNLSKRYTLCSAEEATITLTVTMVVKGVASRTEVYHFPRKIAEGERFLSCMVGQTGLGPDGKHALEYGILNVLPGQTIRYKFKCVDSTKTRPIANEIVAIPYGQQRSKVSSRFTLVAKWKR
jgi:hypothetical protein